jgi:phage I-like protein
MEQLLRQPGGSGWRRHDLRRTAVTPACKSACSVEAVPALAQPKLPGVTGAYPRHADADEKRDVVTAIAGEVARVTGPAHPQAH